MNKVRLVQGDVYFKDVKEIPAGAKKIQRTKRGYVLAEGEATGHAHTIEDEVELYEKDGVLFLKTDKKVSLKHQEHHPIHLDPGIRRVGIVREYDPLEKDVRRVLD